MRRCHWSLFDASILITCVTGAKQFVVQEARSVAKLIFIHAQNCFTSPFLGLTFFAPASICDAFFVNLPNDIINAQFFPWHLFGSFGNDFEFFPSTVAVLRRLFLNAVTVVSTNVPNVRSGQSLIATIFIFSFLARPSVRKPMATIFLFLCLNRQKMHNHYIIFLKNNRPLSAVFLLRSTLYFFVNLTPACLLFPDST